MTLTQETYVHTNNLSADNIDGQDPNVWNNSFSDEIARLVQGRHGSDIAGTNTIFFIPKSKVPNNKQSIYDRIVCDLKPGEDEKNRTRLTVGGNRITCNYDISTSTTKFTTVKLLLNSVVSTTKENFMTIDVKQSLK